MDIFTKILTPCNLTPDTNLSKLEKTLSGYSLLKFTGSNGSFLQWFSYSRGFIEQTLVLWTTLYLLIFFVGVHSFQFWFWLMEIFSCVLLFRYTWCDFVSTKMQKQWEISIWEPITRLTWPTYFTQPKIYISLFFDVEANLSYYSSLCRKGKHLFHRSVLSRAQQK